MKQVKMRIENRPRSGAWHNDFGPVMCVEFIEKYIGKYPAGQKATLYIIPDEEGLFMIDRYNGRIFWNEYAGGREPNLNIFFRLSAAIIKNLGLEEGDPIMRVSVYMET